MPSTASRKAHPMALRLPAEDIALIDRAAKMSRRSRSEFMRDAAVREAEDIVLSNTFTAVSRKDFARIMASIDAPAQDMPRLRDLLNRKAPWET